MSISYKIALGFFLLLLAALAYLEASEPEPVNWNPSYSSGDKIPLGSYVLFENLKDQNFSIQEVNVPPYEFLSNNTPKGIYFFLNDRLAFDEDELERLLNWVSEGNTLFLAAENISENVLDTLGLENEPLIPSDGLSFKPMFGLTHPDLTGDGPYLFDYESYLPVFTDPDSLQRVLGVTEFYADSLNLQNPRPNYLSTPFGKGEILIHSSPKAFSNFFLLDENNFGYAEKALGYLPTGETLYWDRYYKSGKSFFTSPLYILLNNKALKWAYYFAIIGSILFILFEGKRKQRSIPVIKPLENQTYHFTRTISGLYLDRKDYKKIASKKITLFLEYIRTQLRISTSDIDQDFYEKLASGTGYPQEEVVELFQRIREVQQKEKIDKDELLKLNSAIDKFKSSK